MIVYSKIHAAVQTRNILGYVIGFKYGRCTVFRSFLRRSELVALYHTKHARIFVMSVQYVTWLADTRPYSSTRTEATYTRIYVLHFH